MLRTNHKTLGEILAIANSVPWELEQPDGFLQTHRSQNADDYIKFNLRRIQRAHGLDGWFDLYEASMAGVLDDVFLKAKFVAYVSDVKRTYPALGDFLFKGFLDIDRYSGEQLAHELPGLIEYQLRNFFAIRRLVRRITGVIGLSYDEDQNDREERLLRLGWFEGEVSVRNRRIVFDPPWYVEPFTGTDPSDIRRCPICGNVYMRARKDKKTCSRKCSNTLSQRVYLSKAENKEKVRVDRQANYTVKKRLRRRGNVTL